MNFHALAGVREGLRNSKWSIPAILFTLTAVTYGPLIPSLGFYWDDWPVINILWNRGDLWSFYAFDRPFSAWTYLITGPVLGIRPIGWHLFTLALRWLTAVGAWWTFKQVWPGHPVKVVSASLLFAVFPSFTLQPMAVAFSQHFITYAVFVFSLGAMLAARNRPAQRGRLSLLALSLQVIHLATMEYFWGLELIRPVLLWVLLDGAASQGVRFKSVLRAWAPYAAVMTGYLIWRLFFLELPEGDPNALALLDLYRTDLVGGLLHSFNIVARDILFMLYKTWTTSLGPSLIDATDRFLLVSWGLAIFTGVLTFLFLNRQRGQDEGGTTPFYATALPVGAAALIVSLLPSWITDNEITVGFFSSRFSIPAMFGSSLFLIGLFDLVLRRAHYKHVATAVLVCLAAGVHLRNANDYRWDWVKQERFFRQFTQRVPALETRTAIFSDGAIFRFVAGYPTSSAFNTIYPLQTVFPDQSYWFFELDDSYADVMDDFVQGIPVEDGLRNLSFSGSSLDGLVIFFEPDTGSCLRILSPQDANLPFLPELTAQAAEVSDLSRIRAEADFNAAALDRIFGAAEPAAWCDLFQQAELARQRGDWETVLQLADQAESLDLSPSVDFESFVFIEAYVRTGDWIAAETLILENFRNAEQTRSRPVYCAFWQRVAVDDPTDVADRLDCELVTDT